MGGQERDKTVKGVLLLFMFPMPPPYSSSLTILPISTQKRERRNTESNQIFEDMTVYHHKSHPITVLIKLLNN